MQRARISLALACALAAGLFGGAACSDPGEGATRDASPRCALDEVHACLGPDDCDGEQRCLSDLSGFSECHCLPTDSPEGGAGGAPGAGGDTGGAGGMAGATGDTGGTCTASCDPLDVPSCGAGTRTFCAELVPECAELASFECASGFCADEVSCGICPEQCSQLGDMGCAKGALRSCQMDARGCLAWGEVEQACPSGFCADDGESCGVCANACPTAGATQCQNGQIRGCAADAFGCRSWWFWSECALGGCADATTCLSGYSQGQRGSPFDDQPLALTIDQRGALVMVGGYHAYDLDTGSREEFDAHLYVVGPEGGLQVFESWGSKADADEALAVAVASDNSYVVVGYTDGALGTVPSHGGRDAFLAKWSPEQPMKAAALLFSRQWGSADDELAASVALDRDDTAYVFGSTLGELQVGASAGEQDLFLSRWDSAGNFLNTIQWGTSALDQAASVLVDGQDSVLVAGSTAGAFPNHGNVGQRDAFVSRLNPDGSLAFTTQFGTAGDERVAQMIFDRQGNLLVLGTTDGEFAGTTAAGQTDVFLSKLDPSGTLIFTRQWGTSAPDTAASLAQTPTGEIYAAVTVADAEPGCELGQALLLRWNENATQADSHLFDTCEEERASALTADPNGNVYLAGSTRGPLVDTSRGGSDIFLIVSQISSW